MGKIKKIIYWVFLGVILFLGGAVLFSLLPIKGNYSLKTCLSGSMEPTIHVGSVVVIKPVKEYKVGDVITFKKPGQKTPTTHRIVKKELKDGSVQFVVKGDANKDADPEPVKKEEIIGKVLFSIPYLGYVGAWARTKVGLVVLVWVPAALIIFEEIMKIKEEVVKMREKKKAQEKNFGSNFLKENYEN